MWHDFGSSTSTPRYEGGQACTGIGGYMDYTVNGTPSRWSPCSVGDFTRYYQAVVAARPNDNYRPVGWCLKEAPAPATTTATTTTVATTTASAACVATCLSGWTASDTPACVKSAMCAESCGKGTCT